MKQHNFRVLAFLCLPIAAQGQATITSSNYGPVPGDAFVNHYCNSNGVMSGSAGAGINWDFSSLVVRSSLPNSYLNCSATPFCNVFPGSNIATYETSTSGNTTDTSYLYYNNSVAVFEMMGYCNLTDTTVFATGYVNIHYPFNYAEHQNDTIYGIKNSIIDGFGIRERIYQAVYYDAYGTLTLPTGTYDNVYRLHRYTIFQDSINSLSNFSTVYSNDEYEWYTADYHNPLLVIKNEGNTTASVIYSSLAAESVGITANSVSINIYPIPAHEELNVAYKQMGKGPVQIWLTDISGKVLLKNTTESSAGDHKVTLSTDRLAPGLYLLTVCTSKERVVKKVTIE